jgi:hypothetical protein
MKNPSRATIEKPESTAMRKLFTTLGSFVRRHPAVLVVLLSSGCLISAAEHSIAPALIQAACAASIACTAERWS